MRDNQGNAQSGFLIPCSISFGSVTRTIHHVQSWISLHWNPTIGVEKRDSTGLIPNKRIDPVQGSLGPKHGSTNLLSLSLCDPLLWTPLIYPPKWEQVPHIPARDRGRWGWSLAREMSARWLVLGGDLNRNGPLIHNKLDGRVFVSSLLTLIFSLYVYWRLKFTGWKYTIWLDLVIL